MYQKSNSIKFTHFVFASYIFCSSLMICIQLFIYRSFYCCIMLVFASLCIYCICILFFFFIFGLASFRFVFFFVATVRYTFCLCCTFASLFVNAFGHVCTWSRCLSLCILFSFVHIHILSHLC